MKSVVMIHTIASVLALAMVSGNALAQTPQEAAASHWRAMAETDGDFALQLIEDNHPGAVVAVGDTDFRNQLATARRHFAERLPLVESFEGYSALMAGMAADFRDGHIWSRATTQPGNVGWTGIILTRRNGTWMVGSQAATAGYPDLAGARLESCDGEAAESWATNRIDLFRADAGIEAQRASHASWLLLDQKNPFLKRPETCDFTSPDGQRHTITLRWKRDSPEVVGRAIEATETRADIGLSVEQTGEGYWINLGTLGNGAAALATEVENRAEAMRAAPWVVIDLRGNGGGNSTLSDRIIKALVGDERVAATRSVPTCSGDFFRASSDNVSALREWQGRIRTDRGEEGAREWSEMVDNIEHARQEGQDFWPALPVCAQEEGQARAVTQTAPDKLPASLMKGRLVAVTDRACFSSCLMAIDRLRRVGAEHVGEATNVSTRYMEVRTVTLPSGLRNFSTLMKLALGAGDFGPYVPQRVFDGTMSDTPAVRAWVIDDVIGTPQ
ncbi:S41 family peptidase [Brevundimonas sp.]|uniref:S41 family peptidase n=1 Tax=Brevundimonas sp. TaxID=1871086 RepID=UPI002FC976D7